MPTWRPELGLKAVALYRDGSKRTQPCPRGDEGRPREPPLRSRRPYRRRLPDERQSLTHKFSIGGHEGYITAGMYEDGSPGEIFVVMSKQGSVVRGSDGLPPPSPCPAVRVAESAGQSSATPASSLGFTATGNPDRKSILDPSSAGWPANLPGRQKWWGERPGETHEMGPGSPGSPISFPRGAGLDREGRSSLRTTPSRLRGRAALPRAGAIMVRAGLQCLNCGATSGWPGSWPTGARREAISSALCPPPRPPRLLAVHGRGTARRVGRRHLRRRRRNSDPVEGSRGRAPVDLGSRRTARRRSIEKQRPRRGRAWSIARVGRPPPEWTPTASRPRAARSGAPPRGRLVRRILTKCPKVGSPGARATAPSAASANSSAADGTRPEVIPVSGSMRSAWWGAPRRVKPAVKSRSQDPPVLVIPGSRSF
jgi:hypothetical protein